MGPEWPRDDFESFDTGTRFWVGHFCCCDLTAPQPSGGWARLMAIFSGASHPLSTAFCVLEERELEAQGQGVADGA